MQLRKQRPARRQHSRKKQVGVSNKLIKRISSPHEVRRQRAKQVALKDRISLRPTETKTTTQKRKRANSHALRLAALRAKRERWAAIAMETQRIVLGDGKYVEERCVPAVPSPSSQSLLPQSGSSQATSVTPVAHDLFPQIQLSRQGTIFFPHYSEQLAHWAIARHSLSASTVTRITFTHASTLNAAQQLSSSAAPSPIGVFSFASPKRPGGGYLHGGDEQEEVIARLSSLVASLSSDAARGFYQEHRYYRTEDGSGLHDHSMVYSPGVVVFRADADDSDSADSTDGAFIPPYSINVVSAVPVNAAAVRAKHLILPDERSFFENGIRQAMKERMARALRVFEEKGNRSLVLGAFGCSSSENKVDVIASIWAELLVCGEDEKTEDGCSKMKPARYRDVFDEVVFAVPGKQFDAFKAAFEMQIFEAEVAAAALSD